MKKPAATRQKEKTEIDQLSQAELVGMVLALQKIRFFRTYRCSIIRKMPSK